MVLIRDEQVRSTWLWLIVTVGWSLGEETPPSHEARLFLQNRFQTTYTDYSITTMTVYPRCVSSVNAAVACTGRQSRLA